VTTGSARIVVTNAHVYRRFKELQEQEPSLRMFLNGSIMPFVKIHILEGRHDEARLDSVSNAIQQALRAELGMAPDEPFHIIHLLQPAQLRHTRSFLGLNYSDDLIWLELTLIAGRVAKEKRLGLLKALNDGVVDAAQISPDDQIPIAYHGVDLLGSPESPSLSQHRLSTVLRT
jgi:hypothetical protein